MNEFVVLGEIKTINEVEKSERRGKRSEKDCKGEQGRAKKLNVVK